MDCKLNKIIFLYVLKKRNFTRKRSKRENENEKEKKRKKVGSYFEKPGFFWPFSFGI